MPSSSAVGVPRDVHGRPDDGLQHGHRGGARSGLVAFDDVTMNYLRDRPMSPRGADWDKAVSYWRTLRSDEGSTL